MLAVIVTGPPGAGKSTTATAVHDALGERGVSNAMIEADELERSYPPLGLPRSLAHIAFLCRSYDTAGYDLLFLTATLETDEWASAFVQAVGAQRRLLVRLEAPADVLAQRVVSRDAGWSGAAGLAEHARELAVSMAVLSGVDLVIDTAEQDEASAASQLEAAVLAARA